MVFLFIFLIIILIIITTKIKFEIQNLKFSTITKPHLNNKYQIKIKIYTFGILPIFNIKINNKKINKILKNQKVKEKIKEQEIPYEILEKTGTTYKFDKGDDKHRR